MHVHVFLGLKVLGSLLLYMFFALEDLTSVIYLFCNVIQAQFVQS